MRSSAFRFRAKNLSDNVNLALDWGDVRQLLVAILVALRDVQHDGFAASVCIQLIQLVEEDERRQEG